MKALIEFLVAAGASVVMWFVTTFLLGIVLRLSFEVFMLGWELV